MRMIRERIAQRLKASQNTYAMLTTFQECDMTSIMALRDKYKDDFAKRHGVKLGFMSAFVKAAAIALTEWPVVNAVIDGDHIVYRDYVDISVAVATPNGLVVPVIRNAHLLSFAHIEKTLGELALKAREFKIKVEDTTGGTFTISNGGVYGSLFGTPIINPPQSAILGMHAINKRPVVVTDKDGQDQIAIRPIMYLALTYDHRLIDGLEAVSFLRRIKFLIEDPQRLLLDV
jgi:2-oxoglutarate dehydrogenase E2 component (dihydrolipoamide succinyltransferase)